MDQRGLCVCLSTNNSLTGTYNVSIDDTVTHFGIIREWCVTLCCKMTMFKDKLDKTIKVNYTDLAVLNLIHFLRSSFQVTFCHKATLWT